LRVAILSRGYGGQEKGGRKDEGPVLQENLPNVPHLQGRGRVILAARAVEGPGRGGLGVCGGIQHPRLARDLDLVLLDATDPWGLGYLFPRGGLRESPAGLRRANAVILTRCDQVDEVRRGRIREEVTRVAPDAPIFETIHRPIDLINS